MKYTIKECEKIMKEIVKFFEENNIDFNFYSLSFMDKIRIQGKFDPLTIQMLLRLNARYFLTGTGYLNLEIDLKIDDEQIVLSFIMTD